MAPRLAWVSSWLALGVLAGCAAPEPVSDGPPVPRFEERAAAAGLIATYEADADFVVGGGAAAFDCDADGDIDLAVAGGLAPLALFENRTLPGGPAAFVPVTGVPGDLRRATGVYALDIDNDTATDLVVTRFGENLVLRGVGGCRFEDVTGPWGLAATGTWSTAFAARWLGDDRYPTLIFGNYVRRDRPLQKTGNCEPALIARPDPSAGAPRYRAPTALEPSHCPLSMVFVDWRGDGFPDLWVSNDREYADLEGGEQLVTVTATAVRPLTVEDGWAGERIWGMGLAAADVTGDGRPEVAATSMAENKLYVMADAAGPAFKDEAWTRGTSSQRPYAGGDPRPSTSWHAEFADLNNDGIDDLFIAKGNVADMKQFAAFDPDSLLLGNGDGTFREAGLEAGVARRTTGRGAAVFDADGDGCLDIAVVNRNQPLSFFAARPCDARSVALTLRQGGANTGAVGARVTAVHATGVLQRPVRVGGGHGGSGAAPVHVGLPDEDTRLVVRWPDGSEAGPVAVSRPGRCTWIKGEPAPRFVVPHTDEKARP
jgi:hypothetical protein